jgi:hypothetical protein
MAGRAGAAGRRQGPRSSSAVERRWPERQGPRGGRRAGRRAVAGAVDGEQGPRGARWPAWSGRAGGWPGRGHLLSRRRRRRFCYHGEGTEREESEREQRREPASV